MGLHQPGAVPSSCGTERHLCVAVDWSADVQPTSSPSHTVHPQPWRIAFASRMRSLMRAEHMAIVWLRNDLQAGPGRAGRGGARCCSPAIASATGGVVGNGTFAPTSPRRTKHVGAPVTRSVGLRDRQCAPEASAGRANRVGLARDAGLRVAYRHVWPQLVDVGARERVCPSQPKFVSRPVLAAFVGLDAADGTRD